MQLICVLQAARPAVPNVLDLAVEHFVVTQTLVRVEVFVEEILDYLLFLEHQTQELAVSKDGNMYQMVRI